MEKKGKERKKLSLEEARAYFSGESPKPKKYSHYPKAKRPKMNKENVERRIQQLERRIMEGDLSAEEEKKILKEIGHLEARTH